MDLTLQLIVAVLYCPFTLYPPAASGMCDKGRVFCSVLCTVEPLSVTWGCRCVWLCAAGKWESIREKRKGTQHTQWQPEHIFAKELNELSIKWSKVFFQGPSSEKDVLWRNYKRHLIQAVRTLILCVGGTVSWHFVSRLKFYSVQYIEFCICCQFWSSNK